MESFCNNQELMEKEPSMACIFPVEILHNAKQTAEMWPHLCSDNPSIFEQINDRSECVKCLNDVIDKLPNPNISLEQSIELGFITDDQVINLYNSLGYILKDDDYKRLALYIPFEFLPDMTWNPNNKILKQSINNFTMAYMDAWSGLFDVCDIRANFVDGDVLEVEKRTSDPERVVKAAHMIPKLIERGLLNKEEIFNFYNIVEESTLKDSISDALLAMADMGQISASELTDLSISQKIASSSRVECDINITERRKQWLEKRQQDNNVIKLSQNVVESINSGETLDAVLQKVALSDNDQKNKVFIESIRNIIENKAKNDIDNARTTFMDYEEILLTLAKIDDTDIKERIEKTFRRFYRLGVVDKIQLDNLNITLPNLSGNFSENLPFLETEIADMNCIIKSIENSPELSSYIYPAVLLGGSRLKGYGQQGSDTDIGIFIKPDISASDKTRMRELINLAFNINGRSYEPTELWLDEQKDELAICDLDKDDKLIISSHWANFLFNAVWLGDDNSVKNLMSKILPRYFNSDDLDSEGRDKRKLCLEVLQRDLLQYRLMHDGYVRHYPPCSDNKLIDADTIDGKSMFWDSGYRQIATRLFINNVFLPKITKK